MIPHTLHLKLTGRREPEWKDAHLVSGVETPPFLNLGSPAKVRVLITNTAGSATQSASGLTSILLEVYRSEGMDGELLIAADAVSVTTAAPDFASWSSQSGSYYTAEISLTAAQTEAALAALNDAEGTLKGWMEVRATYSGANILLGSGPVHLHRGSTGGTPAAGATVYYTAAQIDALIAGLLRIDSTGVGSVTITDGTNDYTLPTGGYTA